MRLAVQHRTRYRFSRPVTDIIQALRLTPQSCLSQTVLEWRIDVDCDARLRESRDGYGNIVHMLYVNAPVTELAITATGRVITPRGPTQSNWESPIESREDGVFPRRRQRSPCPRFRARTLQVGRSSCTA